jgi:hypothetical protein
MRRLAGLILTLWILSSVLAATHHHCDCCESHGDDDAPCSICIAVQQVPLIALAKAETFEAERDVIAWISPWIALVPQDVFFDRPLARGPPAAS